MKRLIICLCFAAFTASMLTTFEWEKTAKREWRALAVAMKEEAP